MGYEKDIKKDNFSKDSYRNANDYNSTGSKSLSNIDNNISIDDEKFFEFIYHKAEKLATVIYLVTNLFSASEPLKWQLREKSLLLVSTVSLSQKSVSERAENLNRCSGIVSDIISLIKISTLANLLSDMNASLIKDNLILLNDAIESRGDLQEPVRSLVLPENIFDVEEYLLESRNNSMYEKDDTAKQNTKNEKNIQTNKIETSNSNVNKFRKQPSVGTKAQQQYKGHTSDIYKNKNVLNKTASKKKEGRRDGIVKLLKKRGNLTVKDIAGVIPGCSEKTVQRELVAMVSENILKKAGERRWTRYSLV